MKELRNYNLLFLEDNAVFAQNTIELLDIYFNEIYLAPSIKKAEEIYESKNIHMVVSDIKVEDGNGLELISKVRELNKDIPIIVVSAHMDKEFLLQAIPLKLTDYLIKPIEYKVLMDSLKKTLAQLQELYSIVHLYEAIYYDKVKKVILIGEKPIKLTEKETLFIEHSIEIKNYCSKESIEDLLWQEEPMSASALKNFILRLRKKIGKDFIETYPGLGFKVKRVS